MTQEQLTMLIAIIGAAVGIASLVVSIKAIRISRDSLAQTKSNKRLAMYQDLLDKFMFHNWKLFEHDISPQMPWAASRTEEERKASMTIGDHLNFLFYIYLHAADSQEEILTESDLQGWKRWARTWLREVQQIPQYETQFEIKLKSADLYPDDFLIWLDEEVLDGALKPYLSDEMIARYPRSTMPRRRT